MADENPTPEKNETTTPPADVPTEIPPVENTPVSTPNQDSHESSEGMAQPNQKMAKTPDEVDAEKAAEESLQCMESPVPDDRPKTDVERAMEYIKKCRAGKYEDDQIRKALLEQGWPEKLVDEAFQKCNPVH